MIRRCAALMFCVLALNAAPAAQEPSNAGIGRVVLLGSGAGPTARSTRSQPASLLQIGGKAYLIDCGDGTLRQLAAIGVQPSAIDAIFITHLHFDHTAGVPAFLAFDWEDRRRAPVSIYGPPGTRLLVQDSLKPFQSSFRIFRSEQPDLPRIETLFQAHDLAVDDVTEIYRDDLIRITAIENSHYSTMHLPKRSYGRDQSFSYRIDTKTRSIVFTGDTGPSSAVERLARGADILVSEVIDLPSIVAQLRRRAAVTSLDQSGLIAHMTNEHLTPEEVGKLATRAGVKRVILNHIASPPRTEADAQAFVVGVKAHFDGEVIAGSDLLAF